MKQQRADYFFEKAPQMDIFSITAFGIELVTRYGRANEMAQMLNFSCKIADAGLHPLIKGVFYDSDPLQCSFTFLNDEFPTGEAEKRIHEIATETIANFEWIDNVNHTV